MAHHRLKGAHSASWKAWRAKWTVISSSLYKHDWMYFETIYLQKKTMEINDILKK